MHTFSFQTSESSQYPINFYPNWSYNPPLTIDEEGMSLLGSFPIAANTMSRPANGADHPPPRVTPRPRDYSGLDAVATVPTRPPPEAAAEADTSTSPGRRGDPRMHRAVAARTSQPHMTLMDALLYGGFVFPGLSEPGASDRTVRDLDGVLLYQRKNQLNRRLRLAKQKKEPKLPKKKKKEASAAQGAVVDPNHRGGTDDSPPSKQSTEQPPVENDGKQQRVMPTASAAAVLLLLASPKTSAKVRSSTNS